MTPHEGLRPQLPDPALDSEFGAPASWSGTVSWLDGGFA